MMWYCLVFAMLYTVAATKAVYDGKCPEPTAVRNFNGTAIAETWYVVSMYPDNSVMSGAVCPFGRYTPCGDEFMLQHWYVINEVQYYMEGVGYIREHDEYTSAKLTTTFNLINRWLNYLTIIVDIDYENYAIMYNCLYDENTDTHELSPWVLSRKKVLEGDAKDAVDQFIENWSLVDSSKLVQIDFSQEACGFKRTADLSHAC